MFLGLHFASTLLSRFLKVFISLIGWDVCLLEGRKLMKSTKDDEGGNLICNDQAMKNKCIAGGIETVP